MFVVAALDVLFAYAFAGLTVAVLAVGVRIVLVSSDHRLVVWSTSLLLSSIAAGIVVCTWAFSRVGRTSTPKGEWKTIVWRYPVLIGPAAYYLSEYRPSKVGNTRWFTELMGNRRALDVVSFVAWRGTVAVYCLFLGALVAAFVESSALFTLVGALFVALIPIVGTAFFLLAVVVLAHAAVTERYDSKRLRQLKAVPRVGPLWVRGFRQYYERVIRPELIKPKGHSL